MIKHAARYRVHIDWPRLPSRLALYRRGLVYLDGFPEPIGPGMLIVTVALTQFFSIPGICYAIQGIEPADKENTSPCDALNTLVALVMMTHQLSTSQCAVCPEISLTSRIAMLHCPICWSNEATSRIPIAMIRNSAFVGLPAGECSYVILTKRVRVQT